MEAYIHKARKHYHKKLLNSILTLSESGVASNADRASNLSKRVAAGIIERLETATVAEKLAGQTSGSEYEILNTEFIEDTFLKLNHIASGTWVIKRIGNCDRSGISEFEQYAHLFELNRLKNENQLYELVDTVNYIGAEDAKEMLQIMIEGKRLKDISDLPFDLVL